MNTYYDVETVKGKTKLISPFTDEEKQTLDTLQGVWIFWKKPDDVRDFDLYYAWKTTWPKENRIIDRDFAGFFNAIVQHEEMEGFNTRSSEEPSEELTPVSSIPESALLRDPAFEIEGEPEEDISDNDLIQYMHPAWKSVVPAESSEPDEPLKEKTRYEKIMDELSRGGRKPFGGTN